VDSPAYKKNWVLSKEAFENLLTCLDPDRDRAAERYELIRKKLVVFFESHSCFTAQDHADIAINRVARKLMENREINIGDGYGYFFGVAFKVLQEYRTKAAKAFTSVNDLTKESYLSDNPFVNRERELERMGLEKQIACLERCLQNLPAQKRVLITRYYEGKTNVKIQNRRAMAMEMSIPINALRIRALRIREKLEDCISKCLGDLPDDEIL
jgi:DNA-directed RNA polymerase specialized sigma24 family protein